MNFKLFKLYTRIYYNFLLGKINNSTPKLNINISGIKLENKLLIIFPLDNLIEASFLFTSIDKHSVLFKKLTFAQKSARTLTPYVNICGKLMMVFGGGYITYYWTFGVGGALLSYRIDQLIN